MTTDTLSRPTPTRPADRWVNVWRMGGNHRELRCFACKARTPSCKSGEVIRSHCAFPSRRIAEEHAALIMLETALNGYPGDEYLGAEPLP